MAKKMGTRAETTSLYNHSSDRRKSRAKWSEHKDPLAEEKRMQDLGRDFAVVHCYSRLEVAEGDYAWKTHSIKVQSPQFRKLLDRVFADYPDWYPDGDPYTFFPPFKPLVHRWDRIIKEAEALKDEIEADAGLKKEIDLLQTEVEPLISEHFSALKHVKATGTMAWRKLWLVYSPGDLMTCCIQGNICLTRLRSADLVENDDDEPSYWELTLDQYDWNGSRIGVVTREAKICEYANERNLDKLGVRPIDYVEGGKELCAKMLARGRKFEALRGYHYKACHGQKIVQTDCGSVGKPVSGRVIVDAYAYFKSQNIVPPFPHIASAETAENEDDESGDDDDDDEEIIVAEEKGKKVERKEDLTPMTDLQCMLAVSRVKGFDLKVKEWCEFNIDQLQAVSWNEASYDNLVLPPGEKDLVMAFADRQTHGPTGFDDFVQHKGEGIIILLCGPPGVGKTLTAEAMAEKSRVPLYVLSASDLGITSEKVEDALNTALECCALWNALLLLDEADVFLESRSGGSLERNELVSIFLRRLEYYEGVMFLTTNRINAIDPAFKSRLDLILPYYNLGPEARRKVWKNFVQKLPAGTNLFSDEDFDELQKVEMNGREIKNTIKTALVLAARDAPFRMQHVRVVLGIRERVIDFDLDDHTREMTSKKKAANGIKCANGVNGSH